MPLSSALVSAIKRSWKPHGGRQPFDKFWRPFCSLASYPAARRRWSFFCDDETETESPVYKHALKFQQPSTIECGTQPFNSVSLIGTVDRELKRVNIDRLGFHTWLKVEAFPQSNHSFRVMLKMWDEVAELSADHLKPDDLIYVRGYLGSYMFAEKNGDHVIRYEVIVEELNFVAENTGKPMYHEPKKLDLKGEDCTEGLSEEYIEKRRKRLHLWQVFFANPYEWRDLRRSKPSCKHPDFKHNGTGEALWLSCHDPPWVKRQLELLDSKLAGHSPGGKDMSFTLAPFI